MLILQKDSTIPDYDILVTNPPYSGDHKERCLEFAVNQLKKFGRPFFLLLPNYVATKEYFRKIVLRGAHSASSRGIQTFYIVPSFNNPYEYDHPEDTGHAVCPFSSLWFCGLSFREEKLAEIRDAFFKFHHASSPAATPQIATSLEELMRIGSVSGIKRKNPRQRRKMRQQAMQKSNVAITTGTNTSSGISRKSKSRKRKWNNQGASKLTEG